MGPTMITMQSYKSIHFAALTADEEPLYMPTKAMNIPLQAIFKWRRVIDNR